MWQTALSRMSEVFSPTLLRRGQAYQEAGHVLTIRFSDGLVKARVKDESGRIYNVHLDLKHWPSTPAQCSCALGKNCEHAVACLYAFKAQGNQPLPAPSTNFPSYSPQQELSADELHWYSEFQESAAHDFFSYQLGILVHGEPVSIVPLVTELIQRWDEGALETLPDNLLLKLPIGEGKVLKIELGRIKPLLRLLLQYSFQQKHAEQSLRVKRYQLLLMVEAEEALSAAAARWQGTEKIRKKLEQLLSFTALPYIPVAQGLKTRLRDYQHVGVNWLQFMRTNQFGGILADDMGLGKTVQTLAHLQYEKEQGRLKKSSLILTPTSLVWNWFEEAKRFTPELNVLVFHGQERHRNHFDEYDLIISTYGLIQRDKKRFLDYSFYYLILDEAQFIKNVRTKTTQVVYQLQAAHRLCLTGTPLENHLGELWSLFHFLMPGFLGQGRQFRKYFKIPIEKHADSEKKELLARRVQPFILRRTKDEVLKELPAKTETIQLIELSGQQRDLYEAIRLSMEKKVRDAIARQGLGKSHIVLLDALLKLRQVCCDPRLVSLPEAAMAHGESAKLDSLLQLLDSLMEEKRKVLVFSQFTSMLQLIEEQLINRNYPYLKLTGKTQNRQALIDNFQQGSVPIFLISLKAGGVGLNLTQADTVIHYDPWWNPAIEDQATGRSHRIGQENPVFVYKLLTAGTVEEVIQQMQAKKRALIEDVLVSHSPGKTVFTESDLERFFKPLPN
ncbi:DEAD/DEAH box helicase [Legionella sp. 27cVA30]|uniref:Helicase n=1 Tax=Legionella septentrionalis TaxID=2498109 RepID=A0A3S0VAP2_9GAMM|nr:DEAD/DEAH box helicase [Legionella sp. 27cVA30]MCP0913599.1 DEAD/DEAH box helicase [Legionella sp. 27cVA30]RUQ88213.1 helicase [Legionella septentrionalis]RUR09751.1 helicase [Legionella septentrionalis]RUR15957.1 helicase [Legionella septentrionalis]